MRFLARRPALSGPITTPGINRCGPFHKLGKFCKVGSICSSALLLYHKPDSLPSSSPSDRSSSNCPLQDSLRSERKEPSTRNSRCCKSIGVLERHEKPLDGLPQLPPVESANLNRNGISSKRIVKKHDPSKTTGSSKRQRVSANRSHRRIEKCGSFNERNAKYRVAKKKHNKRVSKPLPSMIGRRKMSKNRMKVLKRCPPVSTSRRNKKLNDLFFYHATNQEEPDIGTVENAGVQGGGDNKRKDEFNETEMKPLQRQDGQDVEMQSQQNEGTLWSRVCAKWKRMPTWKKTAVVVIPLVVTGSIIAASSMGGDNSNLSPASASHGNESINNFAIPIKEGTASTGVSSEVYPMNTHVRPEGNPTLTVDLKNDQTTDVNHPNRDNGRTPLTEADGNSSTVKNDQTTDVNPPNPDHGRTPSMDADGNSSTVKNDQTTDVNPPNPDHGRTPLIDAARFGNLQDVEKLIASKADVNQTDKYGSTALMYATRFDRRQVVEKLIASEANVSQENDFGWSALIFAARYGHLQVVEKLIASKANVNQKTKLGMTALSYAETFGYLQIAELLRESGAEG